VPVLCEGLNAFVKFLACVCIFVLSGVGAGLSDCFVPPLTYAKKKSKFMLYDIFSRCYCSDNIFINTA